MHIYNEPNKMYSEFQHFLTTGLFGDIDLNSSVDEVYEVLGPPDSVTTEYWETNDTTMTNLFYGDSFIFTFLDSNLHTIIFSCKSKNEKLLSNLKINWVPLLQKMTYKSFRDYLRKLNIQCHQVDVSPFQDEGILLWLPVSKLEILFNATRNYHIDQISAVVSKPIGWKLKEC